MHDIDVFSTHYGFANVLSVCVCGCMCVCVCVCVVCVWFNLPCTNIENIIYFLPAHCQRLCLYIQHFLWSIRHIACILRTLHCSVYFLYFFIVSSIVFDRMCATYCLYWSFIHAMHRFHLSAIYSNQSTFQMTDELKG